MTATARAFVALTGALFALVAASAPVSVTWTNPTTRTDGTAIPTSGTGALASTRVEYGSCAGAAFGTVSGQVTVNAPATTTTIDLPAGTWCFRAYARDAAGLESAPSNVASKVVPVAPPNPPVIQTVAVIAGVPDWTPVYTVTAAGARSTYFGMAPTGVECTGPVLFTYRGAAFREVAKANVKLWASTNTRLAAPCA